MMKKYLNDKALSYIIYFTAALSILFTLLQILMPVFPTLNGVYNFISIPLISYIGPIAFYAILLYMWDKVKP